MSHYRGIARTSKPQEAVWLQRNSALLSLAIPLLTLVPSLAFGVVATTELSFSHVFSGSASTLGRVTDSEVLTSGVRLNYDLRVNSAGLPFRSASARQTLNASFDDLLDMPGETRITLTSSPTTGRIRYSEGKDLRTSLTLGSQTFPFPAIDMGIHIDHTRSLATPFSTTHPGRVSDTEGYAGLRGTQIGIPFVVTASVLPAFVATYSVDFGSTSTALGYLKRGNTTGGLVGVFNFGTDGSSTFAADVDLSEPGIYDFFLIENVTGIATIENIQRALGLRAEYFVVFGPSGEEDVPIIPTGNALVTHGVLLPADNAAFDRFFSIQVASPVPEPRTAALLAVGVLLVVCRLRGRNGTRAFD